MADPSLEALEAELQQIWKRARNTRKQTASRRIESILHNSRAELSLRDLLMFVVYLSAAFFALLVVLGQLFAADTDQHSSGDSHE